MCDDLAKASCPDMDGSDTVLCSRHEVNSPYAEAYALSPLEVFFEQLMIECDRTGGLVNCDDLIPIDVQQALQSGKKPAQTNI